MHTKPKILMFVVSMAIAFALLPGVAFADEGVSTADSADMTAQSAAHTQGEAVAWANSQVGQALDFDGAYGAQCVDLTCYYYQYLGQATPWGNAYEYVNGGAFCPAGWSYQSSPQPGDIAVWTDAPYGHVAIVTEIRGSQMVCVEQNYAGKMYCSPNLHNIDAQTYIRPDWPSDDHSGPSYSDFRVCEILDSQFTVMAKVTDPSSIKSVRYAVWTEANGQDDLVWYDGHCTDGNDVYWAHVPFSEHNGEKGNYIVHMYAYDNADNLTQAGLSYQFDAGDPVVDDFHAWELRDDAFTVSARVTSPNGLRSVRYAVWTEYEGQDDLVWYDAVYETTGQFYYIYVPFSEHRNERGNYFIHLYAYDSGDKLTNPGISYIASAAVPSVEVTEGTYAIRSKLDTSKGFDIWGNSSENQAAAVLHQWNGGDNQKFSVKAAGDGSYYIIATHSNKALEVYGAYGDNGASISQLTQNQTDAQRWYFIKNDDGTYTMRNKATGHVIDVDLMQTADGTKIQQYPYNGGDNQRFYLVPIDVSKWQVNLSSSSFSYTGSAHRPSVRASAGGVTMKEGADYTVSYKNNVNAGTATATVAGKSGFTSSKNMTFAISSAQKSSGSNEKGNSGSVTNGGPSTSDANEGVSDVGNPDSSLPKQPMHRLYNPNSGEHFYTSDDAERDELVSYGWVSEGEGWSAPTTSSTPVYRMYNPVAGEHHYTPSASERDDLVAAGWIDEGTGWYSDDAQAVALYRDYNPNAFSNNHNYTASADEHATLAAAGWVDEGIAWYGV